MAELTKVLHFLKDGTEQTAKAYSTTSEAGDNYVQGTIDSVACYIPIGATDDSLATNGRVIKDGTTYAMKSQAKPAYTEVSYTTAGTYTFTVPNGITRMQVAVVGGGGGGMSNASVYAGDGGTSSFGSLIQATGGGGGQYPDINGYPCIPGAAGSPNGNTGSQGNNSTSAGTKLTGGAGFALSFTKTSGTYGKGGDAVASPSQYQDKPGASGGSGGYNTGYITVTPNTTYTVTVGAGGTKSQYSATYPAYDGNSGYVLIAYGGDI